MGGALETMRSPLSSLALAGIEPSKAVVKSFLIRFCLLRR